MKATYVPLCFVRGIKLGKVKYHGHSYKIWIIVLFDKVFKNGDGLKFWGYVGTNVAPDCVEFCNFAPCRIFMNCLRSFVFVYFSVCTS
jgi:hypothetical protein